MTKTTKPPRGIYGGHVDSAGNFYHQSKSNYNSTSSFSPSGFGRVSKKNPCEICGKPDYCTYTKNGDLALCMRVSAGSIKTASNGAYIHTLGSPSKISISAISATGLAHGGDGGNLEGTNYLANSDRLHEVYTYFLEECLVLRNSHADHLRVERGLSETTIVGNLYASIPNEPELDSVVEKLHKKFRGNLKGVAGFYADTSGDWRMPPLPSGFFIPYRDEKRRICGLQIRRNINQNPKYFWFSTNPQKYNEGTSSGAPIHFTLSDLVNRTGKIIVTEGALKADCFSDSTGLPCVALPGVTSVNFRALSERITKAFPDLQKIVIAYDADWKEKVQVRTGLIKLTRILANNGFEVEVWDWDKTHGKGIDDLIANERGVKHEL
jgi:hypothetical protein